MLKSETRLRNNPKHVPTSPSRPVPVSAQKFTLESFRLFNMCYHIMIKYTCDCVKKSEFVQCKEAKDSKTNVKCKPVKKKTERFSTNYCDGHLVYPEAAKKYFSDPDPE